MANEWAIPPPKRRRPWRRRLAWIAGGLVVVLLLVYFLVTSSFFLRRFVLPRVGDALHATVTAESVTLSRLSRLTARQLKVQTVEGAEALITIEELRVQVRPFQLLRGRIAVPEAILGSPVIQIIENPDGTSNLDPLLKRPAGADSPPDESGDSSPLQLDIGRFEISNARIRHVKLGKDGSRQVAEVSGVNVTLRDLGNDKTGRLDFDANIQYDQLPSPGQPSKNLLQSTLRGEFQLGLSSDLKPQILNGQTTLHISNAPASWPEIGNLQATLDCRLTPTDLENLSLTLSKPGAELGRITAKGPLDLSKQEGHVRLQVGPFDRQLFELVGRRLGADFGVPNLVSMHEIILSEGGTRIACTGNLDIHRLGFDKAGAATPPVDLRWDYQIALNRADGVALVRTFTLVATQNQQLILHGELNRPLKLLFASTNYVADDSDFALTMTNLNLADWRCLIGDYAGQAGFTLEVASRRSGKHIDAALAGRLAEISGQWASNKLERANLEFGARGQLEDLRKARLDEFRLRLHQNEQTIVALSAGGQCDLGAQQADLQLTLEAALDRFLPILPLPHGAAFAGALKLDARLVQTNTPAALQNQLPVLSRSLAARVQLRELTGQFAQWRYDRLSVEADCGANLTNDAADLHHCVLTFSKDRQPAGRIELSGQYHLTNGAGAFSLKLADLNQALLGPLIDPALGDKRLASVAASADVSGRLDPAAASTVQGSLQITKLLVDDPQKHFPKEPAQFDLTLAGGLQKGRLDLREVTGRAFVGNSPGGTFNVSGDYDLKKRSGRTEFRLNDLNEHALGPFLGTAFGNSKLASMSINGTAQAAVDADEAATFNGDLSITNLVVIDPAGQRPATPLALGVRMGGSLAQHTLNLQKFQLELSGTERAANQLSLTSRLDFARSNALSGEVFVASDALDLTPFFSLFGTPKPAAAPQPARPPTASTSPPAAGRPENSEPAAVALPFGRLDVALKIGKLYLGEISIENWLAHARIDGSKVTLGPFDLALNRAPVKASAEFDLGLPGWRYELSLSAERLSIDPIINTLEPARRGQVRGDLSADARFRGAGLTGRQLREHLAGHVNFSLTKAQLDITSPVVKAVLTPIALMLRAPELLNSPLTSVTFGAQADGGRLHVSQLNLASDTFTAQTQGGIPIADDLLKSPIDHWPVQFSLSRSMAGSIKMVPRNAPADAAFVQMPNFIKLVGVLGEPKAELSPSALAGTALEKLTDKLVPKKLSPGPLNPLPKP